MPNPVSADSSAHEVAQSAFLVLPEEVRPPALCRLTAAQVAAAIDNAPLGIFVTENLTISSINQRAQPAFVQFPNVIGMEWPDFLAQYWDPVLAKDVTEIVKNTFTTGLPYSSIRFLGERAESKKEEVYDWEVHRITTLDGKQMLVCYFAGPN